MSWAERLLQLGSARSGVSLRHEIASLRQGMLASAERLARHARSAPNLAAERHLARLGEEDRKLAADLGEALRAFGTVLPGTSAGEGEIDGLNHWARLCQNLEHHAAVVGRLVELANRADDPSLAGSLRQIAASEERHVAELRDLIARADPQALD